MSDQLSDMSRALMVDGNAAAGMLQEIFGEEMTASPIECAHCGAIEAFGALMALTQGPGIVSRCQSCEGVILRLVVSPNAFLLDARGAVYLRIQRHAL